MTFRFLAPAEAELLEAISYYSAIRTELGFSFQVAVAKAVRSAAAHPERGAPRSKNSRRWLVKGFPYGVIYRVREDELVIVAVAHERKSPEFWVRRL